MRLHPLLSLDEGLGLALDHLEKEGQVARVITHRIFDEEDDAYEARAGIGIDIAEILDLFEHPDEELRVAVPHEHPVHRLEARPHRRGPVGRQRG